MLEWGIVSKTYHEALRAVAAREGSKQRQSMAT